MALVDYYNTNDDADLQVRSANTWGQTFTASQDYDIGSVKLKLAASGNPSSHTMTVSLQGVDGEGKPDGVELTSGTLSGADPYNGGEDWYEITFDAPQSLTSGTQYSLVITSDTAGSTSVHIDWRGDISSPTYANGKLWYSGDGGSSWGASGQYDGMFETYSVEGETYAEGTKTVTATGSVSLSTELVVRTEGTKTVTAAASVTLSTESYKSNTGFPTDRPSDYDGDLYWDETTATWSSTRVEIAGAWGQNVIAVSEEGEVYFGTV